MHCRAYLSGLPVSQPAAKRSACQQSQVCTGLLAHSPYTHRAEVGANLPTGSWQLAVVHACLPTCQQCSEPAGTQLALILLSCPLCCRQVCVPLHPCPRSGVPHANRQGVRARQQTAQYIQGREQGLMGYTIDSCKSLVVPSSTWSPASVW